MSTVGGVPPKGRAGTNFDEVSKDLIAKGEALKGKAQLAIKKAADEVQSSGSRGSEAALNLVGAAVNLGKAGGHGLDAGVQTVNATARGIAGVAVGTAGVVVGAGEMALSGTAKALTAVARGFTAIANFFSRTAGEGTTATVKEVEGPGRERLSTKLFNVAGGQFKLSAAGYKAAWNSFEQSVNHALGAGVNVGFAAGYTALATVDLIQAAGRAGQAGVLKFGDAALLISALGVQAAENGVQGAADLTLLGAKLTAALGRLAASPADADKITIEVQQAKNAYDASFRELLKSNPKLRDLPAAKQYMAQQAAH